MNEVEGGAVSENPRTKCQVCGEGLSERVVHCLACRTPHHEECWRYTGVCSIYACRETRYVAGGKVVGQARRPARPVRPGGWWGWWIFAAAAAITVVIALGSVVSGHRPPGPSTWYPPGTGGTGGEEPPLSGNLEAGIRMWTQFIEREPGAVEAYYERGMRRRAAGDLAGAMEDFTKIIELNPRDADAHYWRGTIRRSRGDPEGAISDFRTTIGLEPRYSRARQALDQVKQSTR